MRLSELFTPLVDFLFPKSAAVRLLEAMSPGELLAKLPAAPATTDDVVALFAYHHPLVRDLVWELKYHGNRRVAGQLAVILLDALRQELADRALFDNFVNPLFIPTPVSRERRRTRGYNQTEVLAKEIKKLDADNLLAYSPALIKTRHTESQTHHSRAERLSNLQDSMRVGHPELVRNRNVILLDDVYTTGATFAEAKRALKQAGAKKILLLAVAAS